MSLGAEHILGQVQSGQTPADWQVYPVRKTYFLGQLAIYGVLLIALLAFVGYAVMNDFIFYYKILAFIPDEAWVYIDWLLYVILGALFIWQLVRNGLGLASAGQQVVVLTPDSVVAKIGKATNYIAFASVSNLDGGKDKSGDVYVSAHYPDGRQERIEFDARFGNPTQLGNTIIGKYQNYIQQVQSSRQ